MQIKWITNQNGTVFLRGDAIIGTALKPDGVTDHFTMVEDGVVCWTRTSEVPVPEMTMTFQAEYVPIYTMIPALQYDGNKIKIRDYFDVRNENAKVKIPKPFPTYFCGGFDSDGKPWRFVWHRMSVPGATYSEGDGQFAAMFLPPDQLDAACSLYEKNGNTIHELHWPEQDSAPTIKPDGSRGEPYRIPMEPRRIFRAMLVFGSAEYPKTAWRNLLAAAWHQYYSLKPPVRNYDELWKLGVAYAKLLYTEEDDGFKGFSIGFTWMDGWVKRDKQKYEIGWCGQNASLANSLLAHAKIYGDDDAKTIGLNVLDAWIAAAKPHGLIPTHYDDNQYTNGFSKTVDACNLGTAALQLFEAADRAAALGESRPEYKEMAERICDFALKVMDESGRIGKSWLEHDLSPAVADGSTGAFLSMALCEAARRTGKEAYREGAVRSCRYYASELDRNGFTTAGALDIFTIDKESAIPLLKGSLMLFALTGEKEFLTSAENAAWYLSTWQWHYSRSFPKGTLLNTMCFDIFGGTAVSIHGGMDPFALNYVHEMRDLAAYTGKEQWAQRANGIWRHGQMCISDGSMIVDGKAPRPVGSQDESVSYTIGRQRSYSPSQWLVAWPTAFRLEALRRILPEDGDRYGVIF